MSPAEARSRPDEYGERNADFYDEIYARADARMLRRLEDLAGSGMALELGVGSGRCAIELARRGVNVVGVDASTRMLARLRARDGARRISLIRADIAELPLRPKFRLVYALVNTLSLLPDRRAQQRCLTGIAGALEPGGYFVDEGGAPAAQAAMETPIQCAVRWSAQAVHRYSYLPLPAQLLDEFAQAAGLGLVQRWSNWDGAQWSRDSPQTISVFSTPG